ncbi:MAG: tetratricopeptide repeat protein [Bacteroidota bacterium]
MSNQGKRQLAAIMFTDMIGYTALMQKDETIAKNNRDRHREVQAKATQDHNGEIVQYYGDGTLITFRSAIEAVKCGIEIQSELSKAPQIPLRIGIHTGDIVKDKEGIYGDGVNLASRMESLATAGSIMISDKVFDDIKNQSDLQTHCMGHFNLKNVERPIEVYAIANEGLAIPKRSEMKGKLKESIKSIAVLPFINISNDPENEYFSDGITEELINALATVEGLRVTSRTSSFAFKGKVMDAREIGQQLNVQSILEGSVRKSGNKVRVTAQLINSGDGYHVWSKNFDGVLEDIFDLQDEISRKIAHSLREKLSQNDIDQPIVTASTRNIKAYNFYLKGLYEQNKWTPSSSKKAVDYYKKAIEEEPGFALPYSNMSSAYILMGSTGAVNSKQAYADAKEAANRALLLDPENVEAHVSLSIIKFFADWDWEGALGSILRAKAINPNSPNAIISHCLYYMIKCDYENAIKEMEKGIKVDPISTITNRTLADTYYFAGQYDKAIEYYDKIITIDPTFRAAQEFKAWCYLQTQHYDKAIAIFKGLEGEKTHAMSIDMQLGYTHALMGDKKTANKYLNVLKQRAEKSEGTSMSLDFATLYTALHDFDKAFYYLDKCYEERFGAMVFLVSSPIWKPLKKDRRFQELADKIGF